MLRCCLSLLLTTPVFCSVLTFTDLTTWTQAAAGMPNVVVLQGFGTPGLGIVSESGPDSAYSGLGLLEGNTWTDTVGKNAGGGTNMDDATIFNYTAGTLYGIFGTWNVQPGYSAGLQIYGQSDTNAGFMLTPFGGDSIGNADNQPGFSGTWGFLSDVPITQIVLGSGEGSVSFTMSDPQWADPPLPAATTPEPVSLALMGLGLLAVYCYGRGIKRSAKSHQ